MHMQVVIDEHMQATPECQTMDWCSLVNISRQMRRAHLQIIG
jgi:hypothetical protein